MEIYAERKAYFGCYAEKRVSCFVKSMAVAIWGGTTLVNRCFDPDSKMLDRAVTSRSPRKRVEPHLKQILKDHLQDYMDQNKIPDKKQHQHMNSINEYIRGKINDLRKPPPGGHPIQNNWLDYYVPINN